MNLEIDTTTCGGAGVCVRLAPHLLRLVPVGHLGDAVAEVVPGGSATDEQLWAAAKACPWSAVMLRSEDGRLLYPPTS